MSDFLPPQASRDDFSTDELDRLLAGRGTAAEVARWRDYVARVPNSGAWMGALKTAPLADGDAFADDLASGEAKARVVERIGSFPDGVPTGKRSGRGYSRGGEL